jgi:hypothetical protein
VAVVSVLSAAVVLGYLMIGAGRPHGGAPAPPGLEPRNGQGAAAPLPQPPKTFWGIHDAVVSSSYENQDVTNSFSDSGWNLRLTPKAGKQFVIVRFQLTALTPDPGAAAALQMLRAPQAPAKDAVPPPPRTPLPANAQFRRFVMRDAAVNVPGWARGELCWPVDPKGSYTGHGTVIHPGGLTMGGREPDPPWYDSHIFNQDFSGYLEVNRPTEVVFVAAVPWATPLDGLRLQLETDPPVPLAVGK